MAAWTHGSTNLDISHLWFAILVCMIFITIISSLVLSGVIGELKSIAVISSLGVHSFLLLNQIED